MKKFRIIVIIVLCLVICAMLVACGEDVDTPSQGGNGDVPTQKVERKPTASRSLNDPYDWDENPRDYSDPMYEYDGTVMLITFTHSESINNLFYDYILEDFDTEKFVKVEQYMSEELEEMRDIYANDKNDKRINTYIRCLKLYLKNPSKENVLKYIDEFRKDEGILYAEPKLPGTITWFSTTSNDPRLSQQWGLEKIDAFGAWDTTTGSSNVTVGLIDSGISYHDDLNSNISSSIFCGTDPRIDDVPHGTMTAGTIGAVGNNSLGVSGVCWNVTIASLKACVGGGNEQPQLVIDAINEAKEKGIKILNFSGGFNTGDINVIEVNALKTAIDSYSGLLIVGAGNDNANLDNFDLYPQVFDCDNMIVVGASDSNDNRCSYSNYSATKVDVQYYRCFECGAKSDFMAIPNPYALGQEFTTLIYNAEAETDGDFVIALTPHIAIVKQDGAYYLWYECDETGHPTFDIAELLESKWGSGLKNALLQMFGMSMVE